MAYDHLRETRNLLAKYLRCIDKADQKRIFSDPEGDDWEIFFHASLGLRRCAGDCIRWLNGMAGEW